MKEAAQHALDAAQAVRAQLALPVWADLWDRYMEEYQPDALQDDIECCLADRTPEVAELVNAAQGPRLPSLLRRTASSDAQFVLALAAIRCCLEAAAFLDAVETGLGGVVPVQHGLIFSAWACYRRCSTDKRSLWPLNGGPLHFGPGWPSGS